MQVNLKAKANQTRRKKLAPRTVSIVNLYFLTARHSYLLLIEPILSTFKWRHFSVLGRRKSRFTLYLQLQGRLRPGLERQKHRNWFSDQQSTQMRQTLYMERTCCYRGSTTLILWGGGQDPIMQFTSLQTLLPAVLQVMHFLAFSFFN